MIQLAPVDIYPNPATHFVAIDSILNVEKVEIFNFSGTLLFTENNPDVIDVSKLSGGIYIVKIHTFMGVFEEQIIKNQ
uniref:T9SS type A sorting domain-containing protein n=1 Tax=Gelidibacter sp. TaxID=2018083 RepID=UPI00404B8278